MPHPERGRSMDGERYLKHQFSSSSDQPGRGSIPMWDSSDPDRAPPPLPLNPQSPGGSGPSRAGTSSLIASAHAALNERARESSFMPPSTKRSREFNEKAGLNGRTGSHRRLQSSSVRDISMMLESNSSAAPAAGPAPPTNKSPERPTFRPSTPPPIRNRASMSSFEHRIYENSDNNRSAPSLPTNITPIVRPTTRRPTTQSSILGENTPPQSSTMLALQNLGAASPAKETGEPPLANITNGRRPPASLENLAAQMVDLTAIAQALQREMAALSRRSRDNATDLLSLKEATNTRDEDIRKSLRDLLGNIHDQSAKLAQRDSFGGYFIDNKPHTVSPTSARTSYNLPRPGSPKSFADSLDGASTSTPSLVGGESSTIALLEKILRGMGTRDGQESLVSQLSELSAKLGGMATAAKVDELVEYLRSHPSDNAIVPLKVGGHGIMPRRMSVDDDTILDLESSPMAHRMLRYGTSRDANESSSGKASNVLSEDVINIIRSIKDSVAQGGGLTAEVKALVRELRGEVLGMGRELGKKLENVGRRSMDDADPLATSWASKDDVSRVIDEGLEQMKEQLNHVLREHRRQAANAEKNRNVVDYQEVYNALRNALKDNEIAKGVPDLNRDDVMDAVREAWENYKPEIEVQHIGLGRDEVLECLKQGFQEYESRHQSAHGASRDEVFTAVVEGLKHFVPPQLDTPATLSRDEIMDAVRECLEEFEFPLAPSAGGDLTREDMIYAVKEGLHDLDLGRGRALLPTSSSGGSDGEVIERLNDVMETMKLEFKIISQNNKEAATQGGLERLRVAIEEYVDRVAGGGTGQDGFMAGLVKSMEGFKTEVSNLVTQANSKSREQLQTELEGLRDIVNSSMVPALPNIAGLNSDEMLETLRNGLSNLHKEILRPRPDTTEILDALNEGLSDIRASLDKISNKPGDLTANDEILDALNDGLKSVKSEIETIRDTSSERAVTAWRDPAKDMALVAMDAIKHDDIKNLEVLVTQLRKAVEVIEPAAKQASLNKSDLTRLEEMLRNIKQSVEEIKTHSSSAAESRTTASAAESKAKASASAAESKTSDAKPRENEGSKSTSSETASKNDEPVAPSVHPSVASLVDMPSREDVEAIETIVRNTKSRLDDFFDGDQTVRKEHIDNVESLLMDTRNSLKSLSTQMQSKMEAIPHLSQRDDVSNLAMLVSKLTEGLGDVRGSLEKELKNPDKVTKHDVESVEAVTLEIKSAVEGLASMDLSAISTKEDFGKLEAVLRDAKQTFVAYNDSSSKATAERHAEINGVKDRVAEVKSFLEDLQTELRTKLALGATGAEALRQLMSSMGEKVSMNENVGADVKEMFNLMKNEFEISKEALGGSRIEANEKLEQATTNIRMRIDEKIAELLNKHEQLYVMIDEKGQAAEARDVLTETALTSNKAVTEELKLLIDTLGCTVTECLEKMEEASKTVHTRVEELSVRADERHLEGRTEHQQTRKQIREALTAVDNLRGGVNEVQPQILETVKNILRLVGDHFEHSKTSATDLRGKIDAQPTSETMRALIPPAETYDDGLVQEKLDHLINNKYNDIGVHHKLDKIVAHGQTASEVLTRFEKLDKVHESVVRSAAELSEFIAAQLEHNIRERHDSERTLIETTAALDKAQSERESAEVTVLRLRDEEEQLRRSTQSLRIENESLIKQRTRLTGDVSALETALRLRKDELYEMEQRAESLERRILNGIMDHSRVLIYGKGGGGGGKKGAEAMNRKRVRKPATHAGAGEGDDDEGSVRSRSSAHPAAAVARVLSSGSSVGSAGHRNGAGRRIASLGQMGEQKSGVPQIARSNSARTRVSNAHRGRSWGGMMDKDDSIMEDIDEVDVGPMGQHGNGKRVPAVEDDDHHVGDYEDEHEVDREREGGRGHDDAEDEEGEAEADASVEYEDTYEDHYRTNEHRATMEEEIDDDDDVDAHHDYHDHDHEHEHAHHGVRNGEDVEDADEEEEVDDYAHGSEGMYRRVSQSTTVIANETMGKHEEMEGGLDGSIYEESIDGDDDDDAVLVD